MASGQLGTGVVVQRFDSALRRDLHFRAVVLDGVYDPHRARWVGPGTTAELHPAPPPTADELAWLRRHITVLIGSAL